MTNSKLILLNRVLNFVASASFLGAAAGAVVDLGSYADQIRDLGLNLPKRWVAVLLFVSMAGHVAAKISKTPSQAMAAAIPPGAPPAPAPPPVTEAITAQKLPTVPPKT